MAAKKPPPKGEKPHKERFIEAAKKAGVDGDAFERAIGEIAPPKTKPRFFLGSLSRNDSASKNSTERSKMLNACPSVYDMRACATCTR